MRKIIVVIAIAVVFVIVIVLFLFQNYSAVKENLSNYTGEQIICLAMVRNDIETCQHTDRQNHTRDCVERFLWITANLEKNTSYCDRIANSNETRILCTAAILKDTQKCKEMLTTDLEGYFSADDLFKLCQIWATDDYDKCNSFTSSELVNNCLLRPNLFASLAEQNKDLCSRTEKDDSRICQAVISKNESICITD